MRNTSKLYAYTLRNTSKLHTHTVRNTSKLYMHIPTHTCILECFNVHLALPSLNPVLCWTTSMWYWLTDRVWVNVCVCVCVCVYGCGWVGGCTHAYVWVMKQSLSVYSETAITRNRFSPNASGPEASWCARIIRPGSSRMQLARYYSCTHVPLSVSGLGVFFHRQPGSYYAKPAQIWFGSGWQCHCQVLAKWIQSGSKPSAKFTGPASSQHFWADSDWIQHVYWRGPTDYDKSLTLNSLNFLMSGSWARNWMSLMW